MAKKMTKAEREVARKAGKGSKPGSVEHARAFEAGVQEFEAEAVHEARKGNPEAAPETPTVEQLMEAGVIGKDGKVAKQPAPKKVKTPRADGLVDLPKLKRVRKPKAPKACSCGCGGQTKGGRFLPGHDARLHGWCKRVEVGLIELKDIPEGERQAVAAHMKAGK